MFCIMDNGLMGFRILEIPDCGYIDITYVSQIKSISKRLLKVINSMTVKKKVKQRARESHRNAFEEEEEE